ncbi:U11/U12 small nuclear ribonucleoprotein 35 kDa protein-like [Schistocerca gregaria]|uniref:U11/U12 small nuclear ribonucleoprotein 35 kDa protein-like n=1 Tax=Schistocerca gregaria TaxID=7010 RepID=UPI00211DE031|nr:U11/U12 small nuclear ribonucleoprotein 35 kDa protein-like [Schistocerca gregaria]
MESSVHIRKGKREREISSEKYSREYRKRECEGECSRPAEGHKRVISRDKSKLAEAERWSPYAWKFYNPLAVGSIDGTDTEPHDRGIARAMVAEYHPNARVVGNPRATLFLARLPPHTDKEEILKKFSKFGTIRNCRLVNDIVTGAFKGYAFIEFKHERDAVYAYGKAKGLLIQGKEVLVDYEQERILPGWVPRRLGGGFGGKKESGQLRFGCRDRPFRKPYTMLDV